MKLNVTFLALALTLANYSSAAPLPSTVDGEGHSLDQRALAAIGEFAAKAGSKLGSSFGRGGEEEAGAAASKTSTGEQLTNGLMIGSMAMPFLQNQNKRSSTLESFHSQEPQIGHSIVNLTTVKRAGGGEEEEEPAIRTSPRPSTGELPTQTGPAPAIKPATDPVTAPQGNLYQENASTFNNGWGMFNAIGQTVSAGINLNTSQDHRRRSQIDPLVSALHRRIEDEEEDEPVFHDALEHQPPPSTTNETPQITTNETPHTTTNEIPQTSSSKSSSYKPSDLFSSGQQTFSTAYMGMNIATALNNNNAAQNGQRRSLSTLERRLSGPWMLPAMLMGGSGVSVTNSKTNEQAVDNGNVHVSGASSGLRRSFDDHDELSKRLFNVGVSHYDINEQSIDNGNFYHSGATSGFRKRLFNIGVSHYDTNEQSIDNENIYKSGATSGFKRSPLGPWALPAMMLSSSSVDVSNQKVNEQSVGNGNMRVSGASSGAHRRSIDDETLIHLQRRLFSFNDDHESVNEQSIDNGNVYESGATSGFGKRLISVSTAKQSTNEQSVGNGNYYHSGATSGFNGVPPAQAMKMMNAGTAMGLPGK